MDAGDIARIIAVYLRDRDDIAAADIVDDPKLEIVGVETQGGSVYKITVERA